MHTWALAIHPVEPDTIFAGTNPSAVFRSREGGQKWEKLSIELAEECPAVIIPRVTALLVDPGDHRTVWAGIEVDGVRRSTDGGDTWTSIDGDLADPDIHDIAVTGGDGKAVLVTTPREVFSSTDGGESWHGLGVMKQFPYSYTCAIAIKEDNPQSYSWVMGRPHGPPPDPCSAPKMAENLGNPAVTYGTQQLHYRLCDPPIGPQSGARRQRLWTVILQRRRRGLLEESYTGIH